MKTSTEIIIPGGTYYISESIRIINKSVTLIAKEKDNSFEEVIIINNGNSPYFNMFDINLDDKPQYKVNIVGLIIDGNKESNKISRGLSIDIKDNSSVLVQDCTIKNNYINVVACAGKYCCRY